MSCVRKKGYGLSLVPIIDFDKLKLSLNVGLQITVPHAMTKRRHFDLSGLQTHLSTGMISDTATSTGSPASTADDDGFVNLGISNVNDLHITCFSDVVNDITLNFQIIRLPNEIYAWIGCNSAKFGHLYAAAPTRPNNTVSVSSLLGGTSDNTASGIARRIVIKTGISVMLACNIPKDSPMLEAAAEKKLVQKLTALGYTKSKNQELSL